MKNKKLKLSVPSIKSFITSIPREEKVTIAGGVKFLKPINGMTIYTCLSGCNIDCEQQTNNTIG